MKIAVVGGGISGLAAAHELVKRGQDVVLFEGESRTGGKIQSFSRGGFWTEAGPNGFIDNEPVTKALVEELGLGPKLRVAGPVMKRRFIYSRGMLREVNPRGVIASGLMPFSGRMRLFVEPFTPRRKDDSDETLHDFITRHIGHHAAEILIDAMQSGIYAGDPDKLSLRAVFPRLWEIERDHRSLVVGMFKARRRGERKSPTAGMLCSFEGGLEALTDALAARLGDRVRRGAEVKELSLQGNGWRLSAGGESLLAERVVLAIPAYCAAALVRGFDAELAKELDEISYATVSAVHLGYPPGADAQRLAGFGFVVPERERRKLLGTLFISSFFPWRAPDGSALLTVMVGGARHPERATLPDPELLKMVREELAAMAGVTSAPSFEQVVRWDKAIPQYNVGHLARLDRVQQRLARFPHLHLAGNAYRGVGMNDCIRNALKVAERASA